MLLSEQKCDVTGMVYRDVEVSLATVMKYLNKAVCALDNNTIIYSFRLSLRRSAERSLRPDPGSTS